MSQTWGKRITAWGMMGLLVVALDVGFAQPAKAVPIPYNLDGGLASGGFILDDSLVLGPYIAYAIDIGGQSFNSLSAITIVNALDGGLFVLYSQNPVGSTFRMNTELSTLSYRALFDNSTGVVIETDGRIKATTNVPEPTPGVLLMIGLLVLAGARWWTHRQQGLQRG